MFKPQLLYRPNPPLHLLPYPVLISDKLDGIRCPIPREYGPISRSMGVPPNEFLRASLARKELFGLDGEVIVGEPNAKEVFTRSNTFWKRHHMEVPFSYYVFDDFSVPDMPYQERLQRVVDRVTALPNYQSLTVKPLLHTWVADQEALEAEEERIITEGYEGVVIRCPFGKYKFNRTTLREMNAFKLKRFIDSEARIIGFVEELHNANDEKRNEAGYMKRQTLAENMVPKGTLGSFIVQDIQENDADHKFHGAVFNVGSGFDAADRLDFWNDRDNLYGKIITYKYFAKGAKDVPRHPVYKGFRSPEDMLQ